MEINLNKSFSVAEGGFAGYNIFWMYDDAITARNNLFVNKLASLVHEFENLFVTITSNSTRIIIGSSYTL